MENCVISSTKIDKLPCKQFKKYKKITTIQRFYFKITLFEFQITQKGKIPWLRSTGLVHQVHGWKKYIKISSGFQLLCRRKLQEERAKGT